MSKIDRLVAELDDAYYDNRDRHLEAIGRLRDFVTELTAYIDSVDASFYQEAIDSRRAINDLQEFVK